MSEPPTTRSNKDGFRGEYPSPNQDWAEQMYRDAGMEPPWLLEYEDGEVVGPKTSIDPRPQPPTVSAPRLQGDTRSTPPTGTTAAGM